MVIPEYYSNGRDSGPSLLTIFKYIIYETSDYN
jgi:hypothetical protein